MLDKIFRSANLADKISQEHTRAFSGKRNYFFEVSLEIESAQGCEVWLPIPPSTTTQTKKKEKFSSSVKYLQDEKFANQVALFEISKTVVKTSLTYQLEVEIAPKKIDSFSGNLKDYQGKEAQLYLESDSYFNKETPRIKKIVGDLVGSKEEIGQIVPLLNNFVKEKLVYGAPIEGLYSAQDALEKSKVDCGGFDSLLGALLRASGIPCRLVSGFLMGYPGEHMHAWLEFLTPQGDWVPLDPSMEWLRKEGRDWKPGGLGEAGNDRLVISYGTNIKIRDKTFPLFQHPLVFSAGKVEVKRAISSQELG